MSPTLTCLPLCCGKAMRFPLQRGSSCPLTNRASKWDCQCMGVMTGYTATFSPNFTCVYKDKPMSEVCHVALCSFLWVFCSCGTKGYVLLMLWYYFFFLLNLPVHKNNPSEYEIFPSFRSVPRQQQMIIRAYLMCVWGKTGFESLLKWWCSYLEYALVLLAFANENKGNLKTWEAGVQRPLWTEQRPVSPWGVNSSFHKSLMMQCVITSYSEDIRDHSITLYSD